MGSHLSYFEDKLRKEVSIKEGEKKSTCMKMSNVKIFNDRKNEEQLIYQNTKMIN